ncbi:MAG: phage tail tip lysozyme [Oscillospiraceae bacterium]|nr:phage tail tip lysozyme [Oscillospiraceae bacterium]
MKFRKCIISFILMLSLILSMVAGVGLAYAAAPTEVMEADDIIVCDDLQNDGCCSDGDILDEPDDSDDYEEIVTEADDPEYYGESLSVQEIESEVLALGAIEQFVARLYLLVLDRDYDQAGLQMWSSMLRSRQYTGAHVAHGFFFSAEFDNRNLDDDAFVYILYRALLDRMPDPAGRAAWVNQLSIGLPREDVFAGFVNSVEFGRLCEVAGISRGTFIPPLGGVIQVFVTRMYRTTLQREPDVSGLNNWTNELLNGRTTGAAIAYGFIFSDEMFDRNLTNRQFVEILYNSLLGRTSDPDGLNAWVNQLENSVSRYSVFLGFVYSREFDLICREHGIVRGVAPHPENAMRGDSMVARIWNLIVIQQLRGISDRPEHIAGIIGNLQSEAGPTLCPFQQQVGGNQAGLGLMQWSFGRRISLENFMWRNGISQSDFTREMNRHLTGVCASTCIHPPEFLARVLEIQINFMFYELRTTSERLYMNFVDFPENKTGIAGARAYAELFCALALRPGPGRESGLDDIQDVGVLFAREVSPFGGVDNLDRVSFSGLEVRRNRAEQVFRQFMTSHR